MARRDRIAFVVEDRALIVALLLAILVREAWRAVFGPSALVDRQQAPERRFKVIGSRLGARLIDLFRAAQRQLVVAAVFVIDNRLAPIVFVFQVGSKVAPPFLALSVAEAAERLLEVFLRLALVAFAFDYRGARIIAFALYEALFELAARDQRPTEVFDEERDRILVVAAEKLDRGDVNASGQPVLNRLDLPPILESGDATSPDVWRIDFAKGAPGFTMHPDSGQAASLYDVFETQELARAWLRANGYVMLANDHDRWIFVGSE